VAVAVAAGSSGGWLWLVVAGAGYGLWRHQGRTTNAMAAGGGLWESQLILVKFPLAYDTLSSLPIVGLEKKALFGFISRGGQMCFLIHT
jgi:hypothetical protein